MRAGFLIVFGVGLFGVAEFGLPVAAQPPKDGVKDAPKEASKDTVAAEFTRTKLLKSKVSGDFTEVRLGEILKEFAHQVDTQADQLVMWAYGANFPFAQKVTFVVKDKPLEVALDQLLKKAGGDLGYVVVSKDGDKYDGWVRLTTAGERGFDAPPATAEDEATATERLALAKKLIDANKPAAAKPLLQILVKKYPTTKAGVEAKELLEKIEKDK